MEYKFPNLSSKPFPTECSILLFNDNYLVHKRGNPHVGKHQLKLVGWILFLGLDVSMTTCYYNSSTSWQDEIMCWCLIGCPTSFHSHTCHYTPGLRRVEGASPASSCPDWILAFPMASRLSLPASTQQEVHKTLMCLTSSSVLGCSGCLAPCHWCLCLREKCRKRHFL